MSLRLEPAVDTEDGERFATRPVRPKVGRLLNVLLFLFMALLFPVILTWYAASQGVLAPWGGIRGTVTVTSCDLPSKTGQGCEGRFVSRDDPQIVIENLVLNEFDAFGRELEIGDELAARVASPQAKHAFPAGFSVFVLMIPLLLVTAWYVGIWAVIAWPLRAAIHLFKPDVWPRWITAQPRRMDPRTWPFCYWTDSLPSQHPGWIRGLIRLAKATAGVLLAAWAVLLPIIAVALFWP